MRADKLLLQIREPWLDRVSRYLTRGEGVREAFQEELERFYDLLVQAVESGDPEWLKPQLVEWAHSRTESELQDDSTAVSPIISRIFVETFAVAREALPSDEVLKLTEALLPIFGYAYERVARQETLLRVAYVASELEHVQQQLERLDRSKSDFIAVAAHELKTPLTLIDGYVSMLRETLPNEEGNEGIAVLLKGVDKGTRRLGEIIDDMVDVSMIDNKMLSLNFQPTWINRLLDVLRHEVEETVRERNLEVTIRDFEGSDQMTFADPERLYQALRNVLTNAIKYTPDDGKVVLDGRELAGFVEITVTDTGIGIDPEDHIRIFEKFGRIGDTSLHSSGKTKFKGGGPGLGLPIAKGILEAHGGTIWVESEGYDEQRLPGSTFHVLIPIRSEAPDDRLAKLFQPVGGDSEDANVHKEE